MKILISPAKSLDFDSTIDSLKCTQPVFLKKTSEKKALIGGCLSYPQSKLLPHAKASIVSNGKLLFVIEGIKVQTNKCAIKKR